MRLVMVTGMSGAGKSSAMKMLEDAGYYCVDNLPVQLISTFTHLISESKGDIDKAVMGIDIRNEQYFDALDSELDKLKKMGVTCEILFLESSDEVLIKRYKETRRQHPLSGGGRVDQGIREERERLEFIKKRADYIIDTSQLLIRELKNELTKIFVNNEEYNNLFITVLSFGFKYGVPTDVDLVFDVRFLPNPYYIPELKPLTGNDKEIQDYVLGFDVTHEFLNKLKDMILFLIPNYVLEGKNQLVIGIGCTGGKHRSVTLANELYNVLKDRKECGVKIEHRDIFKDGVRK